VANDYYVDGELPIFFFCTDAGKQKVKITPKNGSYAIMDLELFYHMLQDKALKIEVNKRVYNQRDMRKQSDPDN